MDRLSDLCRDRAGCRANDCFWEARDTPATDQLTVIDAFKADRHDRVTEEVHHP